MSSPKPAIRSREFSELWRRWAQIVMWFALKQRSRTRVAPAYYEALHRQLLATCRELAATDLENRERYEYLEELVSPWLTTRVLERTDRTLLLDLWDRCEQVNREMGVRVTPRKITKWVVRLLIIGIIVGLAAVGIQWLREPLNGTISEVWRYIRSLVGGMTLTQQLLAAGVALAAFGVASVVYMRKG